MAKWDVSLFAYLREKHGPTMTVEAEPTAASILTALAASGVNVAACRLAAGDEFVGPDFTIPDGCEIALIPPVSGG